MSEWMGEYWNINRKIKGILISVFTSVNLSQQETQNFQDKATEENFQSQIIRISITKHDTDW